MCSLAKQHANLCFGQNTTSPLRNQTSHCTRRPLVFITETYVMTENHGTEHRSIQGLLSLDFREDFELLENQRIV